METVDLDEHKCFARGRPIDSNTFYTITKCSLKKVNIGVNHRTSLFFKS